MHRTDLRGIKNANGFPGNSEVFCEDRLAVQWHNSGVRKVGFFGQHSYQQEYFSEKPQPFDACFKLLLQIGHRRYPIRVEQNTVYPFGFEGITRIAAAESEFSIQFAITNNAMLFGVRQTAGPATAVRPLLTILGNTLSGSDKLNRKMSNWSLDDTTRMACASVTDTVPPPAGEGPQLQLAHAILEQKRRTTVEPGEHVTHLRVAADGGVELTCLKGRTNFTAPPILKGRWSFLAVGFGHDAAALTTTIQDLLIDPQAAIARLGTQYAAIQRRSPSLETSDLPLGMFFEQAPLYLESMKVRDLPGAIRARDVHYWVWGWDSWQWGRAMLYMGQHDFIRDLLRLHVAKMDPDYGLVHSFTRTMQLGYRTPWPAQAMFLLLAYDHFAFTQDRALLEELYPTLKWIVKQIAQRELQDTGLIDDWALFPDACDHVGQNGHDISSFNNGYWYNGLRAMEHLAGTVGDIETAERVRAMAARVRKNFADWLLDAETGLLYDSVDSQTRSPRKTYPTYALSWACGFGQDLLDTSIPRMAESVEKHAVSPMGILLVPEWDHCWAINGQFQCWWPFFDAQVLRLMNLANRWSAIDAWLGMVRHCMSFRYVPEATHCFEAAEQPVPDMPGSWFCAGIKNWYVGLIESVIGAEVDAGGWTFSPCDGGPDAFVLRGLHYRGRQITISTRGRGRFIRAIRVADHDAFVIRGTNKLPADVADRFDRILIELVSEPPTHPQLLSASNAEVLAVRVGERSLEFSLRGVASSVVRFYCNLPSIVEVNGERVQAQQDDTRHIGRLEALLSSGAVCSIRIVAREA